MSVNDILDTLITSATDDKNTLDALILQLQHTTITSSDDELYEAPTFDDETGLWTLAQTTANVDGMYVGCYKLPVTGIDSFISSITVSNHSNPASPNYPATVTPSSGSPVNLTAVADLAGRSFNSFCIRSATAFTITLRITADSLVAGWTVYPSASDYYGHIIATTGNSLTLECNVVNTNGVYYGYILRPSSADCCYVSAVELIANTSAVTTAYTVCGSEALPNFGLGVVGCNWQLQPQSAAPFTIKYTFDICP